MHTSGCDKHHHPQPHRSPADLQPIALHFIEEETEVRRGQTGVPAPCERPLRVLYRVRCFKSPGCRFEFVAWCRARLTFPRVPDTEVGIADDTYLSLDKAADLRERGPSSLSGEVMPPIGPHSPQCPECPLGARPTAGDFSLSREELDSRILLAAQSCLVSSAAVHLYFIRFSHGVICELR